MTLYQDSLIPDGACPMLLAQNSQRIVTPNGSFMQWAMWPLFGAFIILSVVIAIVFIVVLVFRHLRNNRELLNAERVKAIEAGQLLDTLQPDENLARIQHNAYWISFWVGGAVPIAAIVAAAVTLTESRPGYGDMSLFLIWSGAVAVAVAGVIGATMIMLASTQRSKTTAEKPLEKWESGKTQQYDSAGSV